MGSSKTDVKSIFGQAMALSSSEERAAYLQEACADDKELRAEIEALLQAERDAGSFLRERNPCPAATVDEPITERPGTLIGPYKLLEQIGEGGFGVVFMAEQQEPIRRKVALKVLKPGMDTRQVIARFEAERQALALMDHPNIAHVFDGGATASGRPYFVMELVRGVPVTDFCDQNRLSIRERLELFIDVCQAVQHAHQKGIIHRDIKPSNVLVTLHDNQALVKVIDFGIAKATGQQLTDKTLFTNFAQMIGTPLYMSPEQAQMTSLDVDTRSDVYSLGVLLYELLTGTTPFDKERLRTVGFDEIRRIIREEEPPKPSTRISTLGQAATTASANRKSESRKLSQLCRGELDWIVMKALEKDRNRRYETASAFAADVQRHLNDEPVQACPPSSWYRLRKLARRHRGPILAVAAVLVALVVGIVGLAIGLFQAEKQRQAAETARDSESKQKQRAEQEKQIAQAVRLFLQEKLLGQADPYQQADALLRFGGAGAVPKENPTIRELLDRAAKELAPDKIDAQFPNEPLVQAAILQTVGDAYRGIGEYEKSIDHMLRARDLRQRHLGPDHPDTLSTLNNLGDAYMDAGKPTEAIAVLEPVRDKRVAQLGDDHPDTLTTLNNLALAYSLSGKIEESISLNEHVRDRRIATLGPDHSDTLMTLNNLASVYLDAGKPTEAIRLFEQVRDRRQKKQGPAHPLTLNALHNLAEAFLAAERFPEAISLNMEVRSKQEETLGAEHPHTLLTVHNLANAYRADGKPVKAIAMFKEVSPKLVEKLGPDHPLTLTALHNLAIAYEDAGKLKEAISLYEQVRDKKIAKLGAQHPETLTTLHNLALAYRKAGRPQEVILLLEKVRDGRIAKLGPDHLETLNTLDNLARAYHAEGNPAKAIPLLEQVRDGRLAKLGAGHALTVSTLNSLASAYGDAGRHADAVRQYEELRDQLIKTRGPDHADTLKTLVNLATTYRAAGKLPEAIRLYEQTVPRMREIFGAESPDTLHALSNLAVAYWAAKQLDRSVPLFEELLQKWTSKYGANHPERLITMANLAYNYRDAGRQSEAVAILEEALAGCVSSRHRCRSWPRSSGGRRRSTTTPASSPSRSRSIGSSWSKRVGNTGRTTCKRPRRCAIWASTCSARTRGLPRSRCCASAWKSRPDWRPMPLRQATSSGCSAAHTCARRSTPKPSRCCWLGPRRAKPIFLIRCASPAWSRWSSYMTAGASRKKRRNGGNKERRSSPMPRRRNRRENSLPRPLERLVRAVNLE
jgi:serine/threonine protein kinase/tetratricopeptide (TPR) repeat protein